MLTHIVLFKLKDRSPEKVAETRAQLETLRTGIETLTALEVGVDVVHSGRSYDLALITRFICRYWPICMRRPKAPSPSISRVDP